MGLFDKLLGKGKQAGADTDITEQEQLPEVDLTVDVVKLDGDIRQSLQKSFIAFDIETTGLSPDEDKIIEIGAVLFENWEPVKKYSTLVYPGMKIPSAATKVNGISNKMVANAPGESEAIRKFAEFAEDAVNGEVVLCAHNAAFDMEFLRRSMQRSGIGGRIRCVDTLKISRALIHLDSYKQFIVAAHFGIKNRHEHRADADAETCGRILTELMKIHISRVESAKENAEEMQSRFTEEEFGVCALIQRILQEDPDIGYRKTKSGYVSVCCGVFEATKLKIPATGSGYLLVRKSKAPNGIDAQPATKTEGDKEYVRVPLENPMSIGMYEKILRDDYWDAKLQSDRLKLYHSSLEDTGAYSNVKIQNDELDSYIERATEAYTEKKKEAERKEEAAAAAIAEKEQKKAERERKKAEREAAKEAARLNPNASQKKAIYQIDADGNIVAEYDSLSEAVRVTGINSKSIRCVTKGEQKTAGGYVWRYKEEDQE